MVEVTLGRRGKKPAAETRAKPPSTNAGPKPKPDKRAKKSSPAAKRKTHKKAQKTKSPEASDPPSEKTAGRKKTPSKLPSRKKGRKKIHRDNVPTTPEEAASEPAIARKMHEASGHRVGRRKATSSEAGALLEHTWTPYATGQFSPDIAATIVKLVQDGAAMSYAAHIAGVAPRTLQYWLRRGRTRRDERSAWILRVEDGEDEALVEEDMGPLPEADGYSTFAHCYDRADAVATVDVYQCILDRALARDGFVHGGTISQSVGQGGGSESTSTRYGTIECAMWILERTDNRMFGKGATRPRADDERDETGQKVDPIAALLEHVNKAIGQAPSDEPTPPEPTPPEETDEVV